MSIDARINDVRYLPDGTAELILAPADERRAPAGQPRIVIDNPKPNMDVLVGYHIWGGAGELMIGETKIAERIGYTHARLL